MPLYEYWCYHCRKRVTVYVRGVSITSAALCPRCGGSLMHRLFSTFSMRKTDKDIYENILDDSQLVEGMTQNDPRALAEWNKRMSRGDEKVAPEYEEIMSRMKAGEWPADLIRQSQEKATEETE